jgi:hypothetical protein
VKKKILIVEDNNDSREIMILNRPDFYLFFCRRSLMQGTLRFLVVYGGFFDADPSSV